MLARSLSLCTHIICPPTHVRTGQHVLCFHQTADMSPLYWYDAGTKKHWIKPHLHKKLLIPDKRILTPSGELWLCDFHILKLVGVRPMMTMKDRQLLYPYYMDGRKLLSFMWNTVCNLLTLTTWMCDGGEKICDSLSPLCVNGSAKVQSNVSVFSWSLCIFSMRNLHFNKLLRSSICEEVTRWSTC